MDTKSNKNTTENNVYIELNRKMLEELSLLNMCSWAEFN